MAAFDSAQPPLCNGYKKGVYDSFVGLGTPLSSIGFLGLDCRNVYSIMLIIITIIIYRKIYDIARGTGVLRKGSSRGTKKKISILPLPFSNI